MTITIKFLQDCQEHIPALAKIWYETIRRKWVKEATVKSTIVELMQHAQKDKLPLAIVALDGNDPIGMACLRDNDGILPEKTPWLGSLAVDPKYRRKKIGEKLIDEIKSLAKSRKQEKLYLLAFDPTIPTWYSRLGWKHIGHDELLGHPVTVMSIDL